MALKKNRSRIITAGLGLLALLFVSGCKKLDSKDPIVFDITAVMPHDDTPIAGVKYRVVEYKYKSGDRQATGWELNGVTDSQGKASGNFKGVLKTNYSYYIYFDYSAIELPAGVNDFSVKGPEYAILSRSTPLGNHYSIKVIPYMLTKFNFLNAGCQGENDVFRYKQANIDETPNVYFDSHPWLEGPDLNGCVNLPGNYLRRLAGHYVFKWEAVRGGVFSQGIDTFYVCPGGNDVIDIQW